MAKPAPIYRKLPGRGSGVVGYSTIWEGETHLLFVTATAASERYRRFFYADIQAVILRPTKRRMVINIVLAVVFVAAEALLVGAMFDGSDRGPLVMGGVLGGICVFFMLVNSLLGPSCTLHLQTSTQSEQLPTVHRRRRAQKILARIQPRILAAQNAASTAAV